MTDLSIQLLGSFQVDMFNKTRNEFTSDKVRALLAYLVTESNQPHRRDKLAGLLWPDSPQITARTNLRRALADLRKAIGDHQANPPYLLITRQTIQFNRASDYWLDAYELNRQLARITAKQFLDSGAIQQLTNTIALYKGPFLDGFSVADSSTFEEWLLLKREQLSQKALYGLQILIDTYEKQGNYDMALIFAQQRLEIEPWQEDSHMLLIRLLALSEQRSAAIAQYETCSQILDEQLGVSPSPKTKKLYEAIMAGKALPPDSRRGDIRSYEILDEIGKGAFSTVYRAYQSVIDREVAIKVIHPQYANHPGFIHNFESEAHLVAHLEHPHIVPLYDYWREPGGAYLVMRLFRGGSLASKLQNGSLSLAEVTTIMDQIAAALVVAHQHGIVHRDLKPANILLDEEGNAYLSDFGIAISWREAEIIAPENILATTLSYSSPEQILGEAITPQTDIYYLGVVLYEMLSGHSPFKDTPPLALVEKQLHGSLPYVSELRADIPAQVDAVIQQATAKNPNGRFTDVFALSTAFRHAVGLPPATAPSLEADEIELTNPYKGLLPFTEADAADFFGRDAITNDFINHFSENEDNRFLAVVGASGCGKSSVVMAGLLPAIRQGAIPGSEQWFVTLMHPGENPFQALLAGLRSISQDEPDNLADIVRQDAYGLTQAITMLLPDADNQLLLIIDQMEELFTNAIDDSKRHIFLDALYTAVTAPDSQLRIIITLRADFYDRPLQFTGFGQLIQQHTQVVLPQSANELNAAICEPAMRLGMQWEPGLVTTIVTDVQSQPGSLPILQYALTELFERRNGRYLTTSAYKEIGGVAGALSRRAEETFTSLNAEEQLLARQIFLRLITLGDGSEAASRRVLRSELMTLSPISSNTLTAVLDTFGQARLLSFDNDTTTRAPTVEVAHEALIRHWQRLANWLDENQADMRQQRLLATAVQAWQEANCDPSYLLRGTHLAQFENWFEQTQVALTDSEQRYLETSLSAQVSRRAQEEARQKQELETAKQLAESEYQRAEAEINSSNRLRRRAVWLTVALIGSVLLAIIAMWAYQQSVQNQHIAFSRELAATALDKLDEDPELSALLALQGLQQAQTLEAESALHTALPALHLQQTLSGHSGSVIGVEISPDGKQIITASSDKTAKLWDSATGELLLTLEGHENSLSDPAYSPDGIHVATADHGGIAKVWDTRTGQEIFTFSEHSGPITYITYNPDGSQIATASGDATAKVWDAFTGEVLLTLSGHENVGTVSMPDAGGVIDVAFKLDGKVIATGGGDGHIKLWDASSGEEQLTIPAHESAVVALVFNPSGTKLASASEDGTVKLWNMVAGENFAQMLLIINKQTDGLAFSPDGARLATIGYEGTVFVWDVASGKELLTLYGHNGIGHDIVFTPNGRYVISASEDTTAKIWDTLPGRELMTLVEPSGIIGDVAYSPDGKWITTAGANGSISIWDSQTGEQISTLSGHNSLTSNIAFSPQSDRLASISFDGTLKLWDVTTQEEIFTLAGQNGELWDVTFNPTGSLIAASGEQGKVEIWDSQTGEKTQEITGHEDVVFGIAFSPNGTQIATASYDNTLKVWDVESGALLHTFSADNDFFDVEFSPDGSRLAGSNRNGFVTVWDIGSKATPEPTTLTGHTSGVTRLSFSPDGSTLATASFDGTTKVWPLNSPLEGQELTLAAHHDFVTGVEFSPDGQHLVTSSFDGTARVYTLSVDELKALAQSRLTRPLSQAECQRYLHRNTCPQN